MKKGVLNFVSVFLCGLGPALFFGLKWRNCLPFSGWMPLAPDYDNIGYYGRYLIFAQEPLSWPLGQIHNLAFPFEAGNIARGSIPFWAIPLKMLSKIFPGLAEFYYYPLAEILAVFFTGVFAAGLLRSFGQKNFWICLFAGLVLGLSHPVLYKSMGYNGHSYHMYYFPLYLSFAYFFVRLYRRPSWIRIVPIAMVVTLAALTGYYVLMGILILFLCLIGFLFFEQIRIQSDLVKRQFGRTVAAFVLSLVLSQVAAAAVGNQSNLRVDAGASPYRYRFETGWGYGGGHGGGFHVADLLAFFVPPETGPDIPLYRRGGPSAIPTKLGFPLTTAKLQDGQTTPAVLYLGTIPLVLLGFVIGYEIRERARKRGLYWAKGRLRNYAKHYAGKRWFSLPGLLGLSCAALFVVSLGYILHVGGYRMNLLPTPSLLVATFWTKFMFARSLTRLGIPLALFLILIAIYLFAKRYLTDRENPLKLRSGLVVGLLIVLFGIHLYEVWGYLYTLPVTKGNEIANAIPEESQAKLKELAQGKNAVMIYPRYINSLDWSRIAYSLAFHSELPLSGATLGPPGERADHLAHFERDRETIYAGNIQEILDQYGPVLIATKGPEASHILSVSNVPLEKHVLIENDLVILVAD